VEAYRRLAGERAVARPIASVGAPDPWFLKDGLTAAAARRALAGRSFEAARRVGKLLLLDTDTDGPVVGLRRALAGSRAPLKARLLDQAHLAGVGNLTADEALWRAGLAPHREAGSLSPAEHRRLHRHLAATLGDLIARGGSHTGDLMPARTPGGRCPRDGAELRRETVGGRTTWWCPAHQR